MKRRARRLLIVLFEHDLFELNGCCQVRFLEGCYPAGNRERGQLSTLRRASFCHQPLCVQDCGGYGVMMSCGWMSKIGVSENSVPLNPMVLLIIIPMKNGYFIGNIPSIFRQTQINRRWVPAGGPSRLGPQKKSPKNRKIRWRDRGTSCYGWLMYTTFGYLTVRHGKSPFLIGKPSINGGYINISESTLDGVVEYYNLLP